MKSKISELMDGELIEQDAEKIIESLKNGSSLHKDWETYHLIGDTLRQSSNLTTNITQRVSQQLASEPPLIVPASIRQHTNHTKPSIQPIRPIQSSISKFRVFAFATAASIMAMASTWLVMNHTYQQTQPTLIADQSRIQADSDRRITPTPLRVLHTSTDSAYPYMQVDDMNNYLYFHNFHKEFSPGPTINKQPVYIYPVTDYQDKYGR